MCASGRTEGGHARSLIEVLRDLCRQRAQLADMQAGLSEQTLPHEGGFLPGPQYVNRTGEFQVRAAGGSHAGA